MAMEERQRQIVEGAGKDESRLNQDMVESLKKWGPYILMGVAVIAGAYTLYTRWEEGTQKAMDDAFVAFEKASEVGRPEDFLEVAGEHPGQGAVPVMSKLSAADAWLRASRTGIPAGMQLDKDGKLPGDAKFLTDEDRTKALASAEGLYTDALASTGRSFGQVPLAIGALFGLASVAEDRGDLDKARGFYTQAAERAKGAGLGHIETVVKERLDTLDRLKTPVRLFAQADLPTQAQPAQVIPMGGFTAKTADGKEIPMGDGTQGSPFQLQMGPNGTLVAPGGTPAPGATPAPAPAPAPTPAPAPAPAGAPKP